MDALNSVAIGEDDCLVPTLSTDQRQPHTKSGWVVYLAVYRVMESLFVTEVAGRCVVGAQRGPSRPREGIYT